MRRHGDDSWRILRKQLFVAGAAEDRPYSAWKDERSVSGGPQTLNDSIETFLFSFASSHAKN